MKTPPKQARRPVSPQGRTSGRPAGWLSGLLFLCLSVVQTFGAVGTQPPIGGTNSSGGGGSATNAQPPTTGLTNWSAFLAASATSNRVVVTSSRTQATNAGRRFYFETNVSQILSNLVAAATSGDVVELGDGVFNIGTQTIRPPVGVTLRGQGKDRTIISGTVGLDTNCIYVMVSTNSLEDLTIIAANRGSYLQSCVGSDVQNTPAAYTNFVMRRIKLIGESDALDSVNTGVSDGVMEDCELYGKLDVFRVVGSTSVISHRWTARHCKIISDVSGATEANTLGNNLAEPVVVGGCVLELIDCEVLATNGGFARAIRVNSGAGTNYILVSGGRIEAASTNGAALFDNALVTPAANPIVVYGSYGEPASMTAGSLVTWRPMIATQVHYTYSTTDFVQTNATANSNLTVNFALGTREIYLTNNISVTNFVGMSPGNNTSVKWRLLPQLVNRTVVWPAIGNSFGMRFGTNAGSVLWTTLTNGVGYVMSVDSFDTNLTATITAFYFQ